MFPSSGFDAEYTELATKNCIAQNCKGSEVEYDIKVLTYNLYLLDGTDLGGISIRLEVFSLARAERISNAMKNYDIVMFQEMWFP